MSDIGSLIPGGVVLQICPKQPMPLKVVMTGVIISSVANVIVLSLTLSYVPLLLKTSHAISRRMRKFLLAYITFMATVSTVYLNIIVIAFRNRSAGLTLLECVGPMVQYRSNDRIGLLSGLCTLFSSWGADGFMLWRCLMLYEGVSPPRRGALVNVSWIFGLASIACFLFVIFDPPSWSFMIVTMVSCILNTVTATLITLRILYFKRYIQKTVGLERNSPYKTVMIICIESSALIVIVNSIYLFLFFRHPEASVIPMQSLVHVYAFAPLLIIYRVARGRSATIRQSPSDNGTVVSTLYFEPPPELIIH
ncbi:hypothetical protein BYT27DRAFT_7341070 [Phlegmacium glaucopus]|nr:hypothetical protein BYT27DRAFT_7341070 [Phlegmacium glaucopus]